MSLLSRAAPPAAITLTAEPNRDQVYIGESFVLNIRVQGTDRSGEPDLKDLRNCRLRFLGSQNINHFSPVIVNNRLTLLEFFGRLFSYEVIPNQPGEFLAGPARLTFDGREYVSNIPRIRVTDIEKQDRVIVTVSASRAAVLIDEPFDITLKVLIRALPGPHRHLEPLFPLSPPVLNAPFLSEEPMAGLSGPDIRQWLQRHLASGQGQPGIAINDYSVSADPFGGAFGFPGLFGEKQTARFKLDRQSVNREGIPMIEYSLKLAYEPKEEGDYTFGPVVFKGAIPVEFDGEGRAIAADIFAVGPAATVRVVPPPEENRPASYIGAIGSNILVRAMMDTPACKIGDPLQLTLTLSGDIRLDKLTPPRLSLQTDLTARFDIYDDTVQTIKGERQRRYVYTVRPKTDGRLEFPPIEVAYFDTLDRLYRKILTDPIPIQVARGEEISATQVVGSFTNRAVSPPEQRVPNLLSAAPAVYRASPPPPPESLVGPRLWGIALAGPALFMLIVSGRFVRDRFNAKRRHRHQQAAAARALANLRQTDATLRSGDPSSVATLRSGEASSLRSMRAVSLRRVEAPSLRSTSPATRPGSREFCAILRQFIGERFDVSAASLTPVELERRLLAVSVSPQTTANCRAFFERHFNASFTSVRHAHDTDAPTALDPSKEADRLRGLIHDIDKEARTP